MQKRLLLCVIIINLAATQCMPMAAIRTFFFRHTPMVLHAVKKTPTTLANAVHTHKALTALALVSTAVAIPQIRKVMARGIKSCMMTVCLLGAKAILSCCARFNIANITQLHLATLYGRNQVVQTLLAAHANPNVQTIARVTPLHIATLLGNLGRYNDIVRNLIEAGANPNVQSRLNIAPLYIAVFLNNFEATRRLLNAGAHVDAPSWSLGNTPLHIAAMYGNRQIVQELITAGADATLQNEEQEHRTAEDLASTEEVRSYLHSIPQLTADIKSAVERGDIAAVRQLIAQGAPVITLGQDGNPLIHRAIRDYNPSKPTVHDEIAQILIDAAPYQATHARNRYGQTLLHKAAVCGNLRMACYILRHGAEVNAQDGRGNTALHRFRTKRMRDLLLEYHADPTIVNREGHVPMANYPDQWYDLIAAQAQQ